MTINVKKACMHILAAEKHYEDFIKTGDQFPKHRGLIKDNLTKALMDIYDDPRAGNFYHAELVAVLKRADTFVEVDKVIRAVERAFFYHVANSKNHYPEVPMVDYALWEKENKR